MKLAWTFCVFISYNLQLYVAVQIIWPPINKCVDKKAFSCFGEYLLRTLLVLLTFALAVLIPCLEQMISLTGAFAMSALSICIPAVLEIVAELPLRSENEIKSLSLFSSVSFSNPKQLKGKQDPPQQNVPLVIIRGIFIFCIGLLGAVAGSYVTIVEIYELLSSEEGCSK